jgi:DNA-binding XRE family transcriptional regulator
MTRNSAFATQIRNGRGRKVSPLLIHRVASGLTQAELAKVAGVAPETVSNAERGRHHPRRLTARALAAALGCEVSELFPVDDERRPAESGAVKDAQDGARHDRA